MDLSWMDLRLRSGNPIEYQNSNIYQPRLSAIDKISENTFNQYILPFAINMDIMNIDNEVKDQLKIFDLFFMPNILNIDGVDMILHLYESLKFFFKTEEIIVSDNNIVIDNKTFINRDNFEELQEIILKICCGRKLENPKEKEFKNETQKKIHDRIQKQREKYRKRQGKNSKNESLLPRIIDEVVNDEKNSYTYLNIWDLTYWQLINSLSIGRIRDEFVMNLQLISAMMDGSKLNLNHWKERIKDEIKY